MLFCRGTILVSDEYEPAIVEFSKTGEFIRRFTVPANLIAFRQVKLYMYPCFVSGQTAEKQR